MDLRAVFRKENSVLPIDCTLDFSNEKFSGQYPLKTPVFLKGSVGNRAGVVRIIADITVEYFAPCDRCACDTVKKHVIRLDRVLVDELAAQAEDDKLLLEDMQIDLYQVCLEETALNLPIKHLCGDSCKGICPNCGKNLNDGPCGCSEE